MLTEAAPRADDVYNPPNEMDFKEWAASMGQLTRNADRWDDFYHAIRRADGMVLFIENFKACLHSQVQQAALESGLVSRISPNSHTATSRTALRTPKRAPTAVNGDTFSSHAFNPQL